MIHFNLAVRNGFGKDVGHVAHVFGLEAVGGHGGYQYLSGALEFAFGGNRELLGCRNHFNGILPFHTLPNGGVECGHYILQWFGGIGGEVLHRVTETGQILVAGIRDERADLAECGIEITRDFGGEDGASSASGQYASLQFERTGGQVGKGLCNLADVAGYVREAVDGVG